MSGVEQSEILLVAHAAVLHVLSNHCAKDLSALTGKKKKQLQFGQFVASRSCDDAWRAGQQQRISSLHLQSHWGC